MMPFALLFDPSQFVKNLPYMGMGMLGIFIVIGVIAGLTLLLNALTSERKQDNDASGQE